MREIGNMVWLKVRVSISTQTGTFMKANGQTTKRTGKGSLWNERVQDIKETGKMI